MDSEVTATSYRICSQDRAKIVNFEKSWWFPSMQYRWNWDLENTEKIHPLCPISSIWTPIFEWSVDIRAKNHQIPSYHTSLIKLKSISRFTGNNSNFCYSAIKCIKMCVMQKYQHKSWLTKNEWKNRCNLLGHIFWRCITSIWMAQIRFLRQTVTGYFSN